MSADQAESDAGNATPMSLVNTVAHAAVPSSPVEAVGKKRTRTTLRALNKNGEQPCAKAHHANAKALSRKGSKSSTDISSSGKENIADSIESMVVDV
jgi:hypothetical protein